MKCIKCSPKGCTGYSLCAKCFAEWPKGKTLEEYIAKPKPPLPKRVPDHLALVIRQTPEPIDFSGIEEFMGDDPPRSA